MPDRSPIRRLRRALRAFKARGTNFVRDRVRSYVDKTDEVLSGEPIDFSSPSVPYYENLATRLSFARVILYMMLLVFVVATVLGNHRLITYENLYYLAKDISAATATAHAQADRMSYPISSSGSDFSPFRGGLVIAGSEVVTALSASGRQTLSVNVEYADPHVRTSDKYFLTFGRGETSFSVYNAFVQIHREMTSFPIYDAAVADDGSFAILTRSRDYTSEVRLYDNDMKQVAAYSLNGYVTGLSMNQDGSALGVVSVESVEGQWCTKVTLIRIGKRITQLSATFMNEVGLLCGFTTQDRLAVVFSGRLAVFKTDATVSAEVLTENTEPVLATIGNGQIAILSRKGNDRKETELTVYDKQTRIVYQRSFDGDHPITRAGGAEFMAFGGSTLYLTAEDTLYRLTDKGESLTSCAISRDTLTVYPLSDTEVILCTPAYAERLSADDFS